MEYFSKETAEFSYWSLKKLMSETGQKSTQINNHQALESNHRNEINWSEVSFA